MEEAVRKWREVGGGAEPSRRPESKERKLVGREIEGNVLVKTNHFTQRA